jgi:quercetin dioxygenase-like cupin family protein
MLPRGTSPMHRTNSIDYGIVMSGHVELELDDGVKTLLGPGDIVVQRGTMHLWRNPSDTDPCRIVFVLIEASPYRHDGQPLEQVQP